MSCANSECKEECIVRCMREEDFRLESMFGTLVRKRKKKYSLCNSKTSAYGYQMLASITLLAPIDTYLDPFIPHDNKHG
ncbi:hypothetical protein OnM2_097025 [Erysiphe neolycopersici]|uniref:Uncharacterized protein n=1 Tax=Erysiphe neolycopersici TaxID=212602 RepID=A0A420HAH2_9PEZI|nr:hypothetical protein OnM2_097025 [Erysiphe neolycopersici]